MTITTFNYDAFDRNTKIKEINDHWSIDDLKRSMEATNGPDASGKRRLGLAIDAGLHVQILVFVGVYMRWRKSCS